MSAQVEPVCRRLLAEAVVEAAGALAAGALLATRAIDGRAVAWGLVAAAVLAVALHAVNLRRFVPGGDVEPPPHDAGVALRGRSLAWHAVGAGLIVVGCGLADALAAARVASWQRRHGLTVLAVDDWTGSRPVEERLFAA